MTIPAFDEWRRSRRALIDQALTGLVGIIRSRRGRFSGIVWNSDTIVTSAEALRGADAALVQMSAEQIEATIIAIDLSVDVAVLNARTGAPGIAATKPAALRAGDEVVIAGRSCDLPLVAGNYVQ